MGYQVYVQRFEHGDSAPIPYEELLRVLSRYGEVVDGGFGPAFVSSVGEICDYAPLSGGIDGGFTGITFDRPTDHEKLCEIVFELLGIPNTCFFGPDLEFVQTRCSMEQHFPAALIEHLENGPTIIRSIGDSWPLR